MTKSSNSRHARATLIALSLAALIATTVWADSKNTEVRLRTSLAGGAIAGKVPSGNADFRSESDRNRSRLNVEVEDVNLADGTVLAVMVSHGGVSVKVGEIHLNGRTGELELNSQDGDTVPAIMKSDMVTVSNAGAAILTGVF
jgi:hypothetical protein